MKKILILLALLTIIFVSCDSKNKPKFVDEQAADTTTVDTTTVDSTKTDSVTINN